MTKFELVEQIYKKRSYLCVGLDTDLTLIPEHLRDSSDAMFEFNKAIIDATHDVCVAYKINTAFYEALGVKGWEALERTVQYIPEHLFTIADAKRGDIGNTATQYANAFFKTLPFDAVTVAPYMGHDSIKPFLNFDGKWAIVLGLTSNPGAEDFELQKLQANSEKALFELVLEKVSALGTNENIMFVVGATRPEQVAHIRNLLPDHFFLVPGVGAQGGDLKAISAAGLNADAGLLVNASRAIIYAGNGKNFADDARAAAIAYQFEMNTYLKSRLF
jgi:orotidine-5'-phosphate decarboxylase